MTKIRNAAIVTRPNATIKETEKHSAITKVKRYKLKTKPRRMKTAGFLKAEDQTFILLLKDIIIDLTAAAAKQDKRF